jgi:hypothetical protein
MPNDDPRTPYHGYVWQAGRIIGEGKYRSVVRLADWCRQQNLPVRVHAPVLREELRKQGIEAYSIVINARGR